MYITTSTGTRNLLSDFSIRAAIHPYWLKHIWFDILDLISFRQALFRKKKQIWYKAFYLLYGIQKKNRCTNPPASILIRNRKKNKTSLSRQPWQLISNYLHLIERVLFYSLCQSWHKQNNQKHERVPQLVVSYGTQICNILFWQRYETETVVDSSKEFSSYLLN